MEPGVEQGEVQGEVGCKRARDLVSAAADDELGHDDAELLAAHLAGCGACRMHTDRVAALTRTMRVRSVAVEPGFTARVMERVPAVRLGRGAWLRPALAWCALVIGVTSLPALLFAELDGAPTHVARHVGASALALAIGLLYVAWRPHRASGLLPLVAALMATTLVSAALDTASGDRSLLSEAVHVIELVGMVLLWMVAGSPGWERVRGVLRSLRRGVAQPTS